MRHWSRRRLALWAVGVATAVPVGVIASHGSVHPSPSGVGAPPTPGPSVAAMAWAAVPLVVGWTVLLTAVPPVVQAMRAVHPWWGKAVVAPALLVNLALVVPVCGFVFSEATTPGCGDPRRAVIEPLPPDVEVVSEELGSPIAGPERWRALGVRSGSMSTSELVGSLVAEYRSRGWPLEDDSDDDGAFMRYGPEWLLDIRRTDEYSLGRGAPVVIVLTSDPHDERGCHNW